MIYNISLSKRSPSEKIKTQRRRDAKSLRFFNILLCIPTPLPPGVKNLSLLFTLLSLLLLAIPIHAQEPDSPPSVSQGGMLWTQNCQPCHGTTGQGDGPSAAAIPNPLPDFSNPETARQYVPVENFDIIKNGRMENMMPPWKERLTDAEIWDAAAQVWRLGTSYENIDAGEVIYQEQCAACHGENGTGDGPDASPEMLDFTNLDEMAQRSQGNLQANFQASGDPHANLSLTDEELWQTLDYIRTFSFAVPQRNGVLTGQVIKATSGEPVANAEVTLRGFQDNAEILTMTTQADSEGRYTFTKLPTEHTIFYGVESEYSGIAYTSEEPGIFTPDSTETTLDLKVYETTTSTDAISVGQMHYIFAFFPEVMSVAQIFVLNNTGDATYVGQNGQTFGFSLPDNATNIEFQESAPGSRFTTTDTGYADTAPVLPNTETIIAVQYNVPVDGDTATLNTPLPADINSVSVMLADQGAELSSDQLQFMDTRSLQGQSYQIYAGSNLKQGDTLSLQLSNLDDLDFTSVMGAPPGASVPAGQPVDQNMIMWVIIGLGGLAIVLAGVVYPLTRPQLAEATDSDYNDPAMQRQKLLLTLARLDEAFAAGEINESAYRQARTRTKAELARLMELAA